MKHFFRIIMGSVALTLAATALAAGPDLGTVAKQSTNWTAIGMFAR